MNRLYLHCGGVEATESEVLDTHLPPPMGPRHHPIDHSLLIESTRTALANHNCNVTNELYGLNHDGMDMFGLFTVEHSNPNGTYAQVVGLRNSHIQNFGAGIIAGSNVFVCDNLAFSAEIKVGRKHTKHIVTELPTLIDNAVGKLSDKWVDQQIRYDSYFDREITNEEAHDIIVRACIDHKALPNAQIQHVVNEWRQQTHDVFEERNAWSLFNCFTEVAKRAPSQIVDRTITLHNVFDTVCKDELEARQRQLQLNLDDSQVVDAQPV